MTAAVPLIVILADDHELIREAVKPYLQRLGDKVTTWEASSYAETLTLARRAAEAKASDAIALVDLQMPDAEDGLGSLRNLCEALGAIPLVVFSGSEDNETVNSALKCGARGFIPKTMRGQSLVNALRLVMSGDVYLPPTLLAEKGNNHDATQRPVAAHAPSNLTPRESESLTLLIRGMTNKEIARELGLQDVTVKMHLRNAYRKLGAENRIDAVRIAVERGLN